MNFYAYEAPLAIMSAFVALDVLTGILGAVINHEISSSKMREGLGHKLAFFCAFALAVLCEVAMSCMDVGLTVPAVTPVVAYIVATEVVSILENICTINPALKDNAFLSLFMRNDK